MKIAISGKGGVGKTLLASLLSRSFARASYSVLAIDADSNPSLAATLGFPHPETIIPIAEMKEVIAERTGVQPGKTDIFFKLNPKVDDLPEKYWQVHDGVKLMVMGRIKKGGSGCYCSENVVLKSLMNHLLLQRNEVVVMDMEAGIEHLGRATAGAVDQLIIVIEPGRRSIETAATIHQLAEDISLKNIGIVGNRVRSEAEKQFMTSSLPGLEFLGFLPYDQAIIEADLAGRSVLDASPKMVAEVKKIFQKLVAVAKPPK